MHWSKDPAFWFVLISFVLFLAIAAAVFHAKVPVLHFKHVVSPLPIKSHAIRVSIDARDFKKWVYFNLSRGQVVHPAYVSSLNWDLAFKRYHIIANGGAKNIAANGGILDQGMIDFKSLAQAPLTGYISDTRTPSGADMENRAIWHWYHYDYATHVLTPMSHVYVVRTPEGRYFAFRILSYYCEMSEQPPLASGLRANEQQAFSKKTRHCPEGESGCLAFEYRKLGTHP